jgi:hypothetical protein
MKIVARSALVSITTLCTVVVLASLGWLTTPFALSAVATPTAPFLCFDSVGEPYILVPLKTQLALTEIASTPTATPTRIATPTNVPEKPCSIGIGKVVTSVLNIRSGAGTNFSTVGTALKQGATFEIAEVRGTWLRLCASTPQWVNSKLDNGTILVTYTLK